MNSKHRFFLCSVCGNMIGLIKDEGPAMVCCGEEMTELVPNSTGASEEKHMPVVTGSGDSISVQVGSAAHPMEEGHHIEFVFVETTRGGQRKRLTVGGTPTAAFLFSDDKPVAVYAYCNLHGLWKLEV